MPQTYNYHPILSTDDEEALPNGDEDADTKSHLQPRDCAICMLPIDTSAGKHTGLNVLSRTTYMMTPCHHMFHTECLERVSPFSYTSIYARLTTPVFNSGCESN